MATRSKVRTARAKAKSRASGARRLPKPLPERHFASAQAFRAWLGKSHASAEGLLLRMYKKDSGVTSISYAEALDQALCFGWIDGLVLPKDDQSFLRRFTPRRKRSRWSKINTGHVERLTRAGQMQPAGQREVDAAKADGRWHAAYDSPANIQPPPEFLRALARNRTARAFYQTLNRANVYAIAYRLQEARNPETRQRRILRYIVMLERGETFH